MARPRSEITKEKLLEAAAEVFVAKGFRDATIAEICRRAQANVAAVNYHFGSKEILYRETWRYSFNKSLKAHPSDGGVSVDASATERLRGTVKALVERIADEESRDFFISQMEFVNPTGLLDEVMRTERIQLRGKFFTLMKELLGSGASEKQIIFCTMSVISMCLHTMMIQRVCKKTNDLSLPPEILNLEAFVEHVVKFSLAGIAAIKNESSAELSAHKEA